MDTTRDTNILVTNVGDIVNNGSNKIEVVNIDSNDVIFVWYDNKAVPPSVAAMQLKEVEDKFKKLFPSNKVVTVSSSISVSVLKQPG